MAVRSSIPSIPPQGIGLFDFDGTLIAWDCQLLFRHFILRREPWRGVFLPLFLALLPLAGLLGAARMKRVFLSFLWRMSDEKLRGYSRDFAKSLMPSIYPELRAKLEFHRECGHLLILVSASPDCYIEEIGRDLGFDLVLGTPVRPGPLFPPLANHKGAAKVERLKSLLPPAYFEHGKLRHAHGYTDSRADLPMLALCESVTVVNPSRALATIAEKAAWEIVRPERPWKTRAGFSLRVAAMLFGLSRDPGALTRHK